MIPTTSIYNIEATLNAWMTDGLAAIARPLWLTAYSVVLNWAEIPVSLPCFSLYHLPGHRSDVWMGRAETATRKIVRAQGMLEVSAWVSRDEKYNGQDIWAARLAYMQGMIEQVYTGSPVVVINDYLTTPAAPVTTSYRIVLGDLSAVQTSPDPNPAIRRRRLLINYTWGLRDL